MIYEDGSCVLWDFWNGVELTSLSLPKELKGCSFSRIRSSPKLNGGPIFYTSVNGHRSGYLVQWAQDRVGDISVQRFQKVYKTAITAFDLSRTGAYLGVGTSDGETAISCMTQQIRKLMRLGAWSFVLVPCGNSRERYQSLWSKWMKCIVQSIAYKA